MKISVLVPLQPDGGWRDYLWSFVKSRYEQLLPGVELCVGYDRRELFNRSRAVNRAAAQATGDLFIVTDADVFFGAKLIAAILDIAGQHPWIIPFKRGYALSRQATQAVLRTGELKLPVKLKAADILFDRHCNGELMNVMSRQVFEAVGGMDERFCGWGGEDQAFWMALDTLAGPHYRMDRSIFHLWHPRAPTRHAHSRRNEQLLERYRQALGDPEAMRSLTAERRC
jgi:predicted glycosyltransferase involved in capsule biosynthesis